MRLRIVTPLSVVIDEDGVLALRAEDATGSFGILPRHADFLTSLAVSVVSWESSNETRRYCAVRRGVLSVIGGHDIAIATREAVPGDDLTTLDETTRVPSRSAPTRRMAAAAHACDPGTDADRGAATPASSARVRRGRLPLPA